MGYDELMFSTATICTRLSKLTPRAPTWELFIAINGMEALPETEPFIISNHACH